MSTKWVKILFICSAIFFFIYFLNRGEIMYQKDSALSRINPYDESSQIISFRSLLTKRTFLFQAPRDYDTNRKYPLVIALHGWTEDKNHYFLPWEEEKKSVQENPCFYLAPNNTTEGWDDQAEWVRKIIYKITTNFPVDKNRIYIIGFSMGGSGSFAFAESLYRDYGITTAAIVRCAGMSRPVLPEPLFSQTALWYNLGSRDPLEGVYETFNKSKEYYIANTDTAIKEMNELISYKDREISRTTVILSESKEENDKYLFSFFSPMDHEYGPVFSSKDILEWLFNQSLD